MRLLLPVVAVFLVALGGCTNASIAEAYGRPDPFEWTYFEGPPEAVLEALRESFYQTGLVVESVREHERGVVMRVSQRLNEGRSNQIYVEGTEEEGFGTRAQVYPQRDPLPRWLEIEVAARI